MPKKMTPTQELILEVLIARTRLGETLWTFSSVHRPALSSLEERGLVFVMNGIVEKSVRASLTEKGVEKYLNSNTFVPQGFKRYAKEIADAMDELGFEPNVGNVIRKSFGS